MDNRLLEAIVKTAIYIKKEGTQGSYYFHSGTSVLPERLSISRYSEYAPVGKTGRNAIHTTVGQLFGKFKATEQSPLKKFKPFECRTQIWYVPTYPELIGYGTIGISNYYGKIDRNSDKGDLVILYTPDVLWNEIHIYFFPEMIMQLYQILKYVATSIK